MLQVWAKFIHSQARLLLGENGGSLLSYSSASLPDWNVMKLVSVKSSLFCAALFV